MSGKICPGSGKKLTFELNSNILGKSQLQLDFTTAAASASGSKNVTTFEFKGSVRIEDTLKSRNREGFKLPTLRIASIDPRGLLTIAFSDPLFIIQNVTQLQDYGQIDGKPKINLQLSIYPVEGQSAEQIRFTWSALEFTEQFLRLQLKFDQPGQVSSLTDANSIQIKVWDTSFFVRQKDGFEVAQVTLQSVLPRQID